MRVAASLKSRTSPAHVVLARLAASSDRLAKALQALGRILKTIHILRYLHDAKLRARVQLQRNRGESRHNLARRLFFANRGAFRSGDYAEIMNKVSALSVLSNAVLVWNTVRIGGIVEELAEAGHPLLANQRDVGDAVKERLEAAVPRRAVELALLNPEALAVGRRCPAVSPHAGELEPVVVVNEGAVGRLERLGTQAPPKPRSTFTEIFAVSHAWFWVGFLRHP